MGRSFAVVLVLAACSKVRETPMPMRPALAAPSLRCSGSVRPGPAVIRRLTRVEYDHTVRDLLGDTTHPAREFAPEDKDRLLGFSNNAAMLGVTPLLGEQLMVSAEALAARAVENLPDLLGCDPTQDACVRAFIARFGQRAWRRPLLGTEQQDLWAQHERGGVRLVLATMLQAPEFLYRIEAGEPISSTIARLSPFELASRLSFMLWNSTPDDDLLAAAASGQLRTKEDVARQARRLLGDPRAHEMVVTFHEQWLDMGRLERLEKKTKNFPGYTRQMPALFRRETQMYVDEVVWRRGGGIEALLTSPFTFVNEKLGRLYGVEGAEGDELTKLPLDGVKRAGLLTQGSFLAAQAKFDQTSPTLRGKFVREQMLCTIPPPPPPNADIKPPEVDPKLTTRERFEDHRADVGCAKCHELMDPIGLGFENYDAVGAWRGTENGKPIDATGEIVKADVDGEFVGALALERKLAESRQVSSCYVKQWFRFAYGRNETADDACTLAALERSYVDSGASVTELIIAMTQTDAFLYRESGR